MRPGREQLLAAQLFEHQVHTACFQETRCEAGTSSSRGYLRFSSGSSRGQFGYRMVVS